jgi:hypothetical protein
MFMRKRRDRPNFCVVLKFRGQESFHVLEKFPRLQKDLVKTPGRVQLNSLPNGAKTQLLMHTNPNYLLDLCILLGLFDRAHQLIA